MSVYERLLSYQDEKYIEFQSKLVPNIDKNTIIGVKTPQMKEIVKEIFGTEEATDFLKVLPHKYYEESLNLQISLQYLLVITIFAILINSKL